MLFLLLALAMAIVVFASTRYTSHGLRWSIVGIFIIVALHVTTAKIEGQIITQEATELVREFVDELRNDPTTALNRHSFLSQDDRHNAVNLAAEIATSTVEIQLIDVEFGLWIYGVAIEDRTQYYVTVDVIPTPLLDFPFRERELRINGVEAV